MSLSRSIAFVAALLLALSTLTCRAQAPPSTPQWPTRFTASFNETSFLPIRRKTDGIWYYDSDKGLELVYRNNGRGDRYCGSIHPLTDTPCSQLITEGVRYLIFPQLGSCCTCCTADHGCGILSPRWLDNATYEGPQFLNGVQVDKWRVKGLQPNDVYWVRDDNKPLEVDQLPNDYIYLHPESFTTEEIPDSVFKLPAICAELKRCPFFSTCTVASGFGSFGGFGSAS